MPETSSRKMNKLRYPMITAMNLTYQCQPCTTMEIFHDISCSTHWTCQPSNTMGCHAIAGMTTPCYCNHYVHAREPHTFQDVSGPRARNLLCLPPSPKDSSAEEWRELAPPLSSYTNYFDGGNRENAPAGGPGIHVMSAFLLEDAFPLSSRAIFTFSHSFAKR